MSIGAFHELVGTLRWTDLGYTLYLDQGGFWVLDLPAQPGHCLNHYVWVQGWRSGFNILEVRAMGLIDLRWAQAVEVKQLESGWGFWRWVRRLLGG